MDSSKTVFCKYCMQNIPNIKDTDTDVFLSHHQKWCSLSLLIDQEWPEAQLSGNTMTLLMRM